MITATETQSLGKAQEREEKAQVDSIPSTAGRTCKSLERGRASFEGPLGLIQLKSSEKDFIDGNGTRQEWIEQVWFAQEPSLYTDIRLMLLEI